ncbi:MAG: tRNA lysidine(34) synthetase TilS [Planctomycetota bacterium]|nr:MAG: tRNA lysidine(34) synthetase TilS [Planctomycetota bacterium]
MPQQHDLETRLVQVISEEQLLGPDESVMVAVSGGADSVALLHLLYAVNQRLGWSLKLHVAHLNHQLRGRAADGDAAFVERLAKSLRLPYTIESVDTAGRSKAEGISIEQAGRLFRLELYERVCLKQGIKTVAVAHHAEDNAETVLHRIIRGTGVRGLVGIRPCRPIREGSDIRLIRPMLWFRRAEIEKYLQDRDITFCHDASNDSDEYTRNRIRNEVLPLLRERFNPQVTEALLRLSDQARGLDRYLSETGERMLESLIIAHDDRQLVLHCPSLTRKPRVIQTQLIRQAIIRMGVGEGELTYGHLNTVADLAAGHEGSKAIDLPGGLRVNRRYLRLVFERSTKQAIGSWSTHEIRVAMEGTTLLPDRSVEIILDIMPADEATISAHLTQVGSRSPNKTSDEEWLDADQVHPPLIARSRRPGDRFFPLGMSGMKKLSDFFIDEKIGADQREGAIVLCDQLGPIWIVPFRIDERVRLRRATKRILRVRARPIEKS